MLKDIIIIIIIIISSSHNISKIIMETITWRLEIASWLRLLECIRPQRGNQDLTGEVVETWLSTHGSEFGWGFQVVLLDLVLRKLRGVYLHLSYLLNPLLINI